MSADKAINRSPDERIGWVVYNHHYAKRSESAKKILAPAAPLAIKASRRHHRANSTRNERHEPATQESKRQA
jgi:hypothetical protein